MSNVKIWKHLELYHLVGDIYKWINRAMVSFVCSEVNMGDYYLPRNASGSMMSSCGFLAC